MAAPAQQKQFTELTDYIYPPLTTLDHSLPSVKLAVIAATIMTSAAIYVTTQLLFTLTSSLYRHLRLKEKVFWNLAVVRSCFGVFYIVVGLWATFGDTALNEDVVLGTCPTSHLVVAITVGFFVFECLALTLSDLCFRTFSCILQVHHWVSLLGFIIALLTEAAHAIGCRGLILEMSTPFSCLCWTLLKAGKENSLLWKANQFLLVHTFHLRNVVEFSLLYLTYQHWDNVWANMPLPLFVTLYGQLSLITFFMTPFWTWKKTRQMICPVDWNFESAEKKEKEKEEKKEKKEKKVEVPAGRRSLLYEVHENGFQLTRLNGCGVGVKVD